MERPPRCALSSVLIAAAVAAAGTAACAGTAVFARLGFVNGQRPAVEVGPVEGSDRLIGAFAHLDEPETARPAGLAIGGYLGSGNTAVSREHLAEIIRGGREGEVADENVLAHDH